MSEAATENRYYVVREVHQMRHDGELHWLHITVTATSGTAVATATSPAPFSIPPDLGRKIADLIRTECDGDDAA